MDGIRGPSRKGPPGAGSARGRPTSAERRTCAACALSKVKCDRALPSCGRCVRLGLACIDAPPSRRGRAVTLGPKTLALRQQPAGASIPSLGGAVDATKLIQEVATRGGAPALEHVREWLLVALARGSTTLFARAALMAAQARAPLAEVFAVEHTYAGEFADVLPPGNPFAARAAAVGGPDGDAPRAAKRPRGGGPDGGAPRRRADESTPALRAADAIAAGFPASLPAPALALVGDYDAALAVVRVCVDGAVRNVPTPTFAARVCSRAAMDAVYADNSRVVPSLYHGPPALAATAAAIGRLHAGLAEAARARPTAAALHATADGGRTALRCEGGAEIACDSEWAMSCYHGGRVTIIATLFRELADGAPALAPLLGDADLERELAASLVDFI